MTRSTLQTSIDKSELLFLHSVSQRTINCCAHYSMTTCGARMRMLQQHRGTRRPKIRGIGWWEGQAVLEEAEWQIESKQTSVFSYDSLLKIFAANRVKWFCACAARDQA